MFPDERRDTRENPTVAERILVRARTHLDGVSINSGRQFRLFTRRPRLSRDGRCKIARADDPVTIHHQRRATARARREYEFAARQLPYSRVIFAAAITM